MPHKNDSLGDRMKTYENVTRNYLTRRTPAIIRLDGKAFHTFTKGMEKPFDSILTNTMMYTMLQLCRDIQGCVLGYTQSDEITLVLTDYATIETDAWFGYNVQKMVSVASSMATWAFNRAFYQNIDNFFSMDNVLEALYGENSENKAKIKKYADTMEKALNKGALFDARVFSIPKEEVCNCLIWRQQDAIRNSIQSVGQAHFSHNELYKKTQKDILAMLREKGIEWNSLDTHLKRGSCAIKVECRYIQHYENGEEKNRTRKFWMIDKEVPIFSENRQYVEDLL